MKIAHEAPVSFMRRVRELTDYCYCLPHMLDRNEEYKKYFYESKELGRYIIMDNSLHELKDKNGGKPYDEDRLWYWMNELQPNEFIVPDFWMDMNATLVASKKWKSLDIPKNITLTAVVQASNKEEAYKCYHIMKMQGYDKIAFSYGADWYIKESGINVNILPPNFKLLVKSVGRFNVIKEFYDRELINKTDRIHLLGTYLPQDFIQYTTMPFIETIDTSNPVIHGLAGIKYNEWGLDDKILTKVDEFHDVENNWDIVLYNIEKFKEFTQPINSSM